MVCNYCNSQIPDGSRFCPNCGNTINAAPQYARQNPQNSHSYQTQYNNEYYDNQYDEAEYDDYPENDDKKNKALIGIIAGLGSLVVILLVVLLVVIFNGKKTDKTPQEPDTPSVSTTQEVPASSTLPIGTAPSVSVTDPSVSGAAGVGTITPGTYKVNTQQDDLNIRGGAGTSYDIIGRVPKDTVVTVTAVNGGWAYITYGTVSGWVSAQFLTPVLN